MSSRLFQEIREKRGLCYSIYAFHWGFEDAGIFGISAATGERDAGAVVEETMGEIGRAASGVTEIEVKRAQSQLRAGLLMALESPVARAGQIARHIMFHGRTLPLDELVSRINAVTPQKVCEFLEKINVAPNPTLAAIGPIAKVPSVGAIAASAVSAKASAA